MSLAVSGVLFVLYPAIRPFSDETSLAGAAAFASAAWTLAHTLAMVGFILVGLGLLGLHGALLEGAAERLALWALVVSQIGIGLILPYYGGETFGLHAIGQEALRERNADLLNLANDVRFGAGGVMFLAGLAALAVGAILVAIAIWRSGTFPRWSGLPFALGLGLYLPQFFGTQAIRVAHGVLVAVGCLGIAAALWQQSRLAGRRGRRRAPVEAW